MSHLPIGFQLSHIRDASTERPATRRAFTCPHLTDTTKPAIQAFCLWLTTDWHSDRLQSAYTPHAPAQRAYAADELGCHAGSLRPRRTPRATLDARGLCGVR